MRLTTMAKISVLILVNLILLGVHALPESGKLLTPEEGCGRSDKIATPKIVGGINAKPGAFPWMALLGYGQFNLFLCGGSLITSRHVLTAAHCIKDNLKLVRLGEHDITTNTDGPVQDIKVVKVTVHEDYKNLIQLNDIAILTLEKDVEFTDRIRPVCLPKDEPILSRSFVGFNPFVAGWGKLSEGGEKPSILQQLQVPVLPNTECEKQYWQFSRKNAQICAGNLKGGEDSCQGDSGGPLMLPIFVNGTFPVYQIGVVSYGKGCARANMPGVYTNVPQYMEWIQSKLN